MLREKSAPELTLISGPNGSGKTTFAESLFSASNRIYLNPDRLTAGISPSFSTEAAFEAGRLLIGTVKDRIRMRKPLAFESTLSGRSWLRVVQEAKDAGYRIVIHFIFVSSPSLSLARIRKRVAAGGHDVSSTDVHRRFSKTWDHFWNLFRPIADEWSIFDNSGKSPKLILNKDAFDSSDPKRVEAALTSIEKRFRSR